MNKRRLRLFSVLIFSLWFLVACSGESQGLIDENVEVILAFDEDTKIMDDHGDLSFISDGDIRELLWSPHEDAITFIKDDVFYYYHLEKQVLIPNADQSLEESQFVDYRWSLDGEALYILTRSSKLQNHESIEATGDAIRVIVQGEKIAYNILKESYFEHLSLGEMALGSDGDLLEFYQHNAESGEKELYQLNYFWGTDSMSYHKVERNNDLSHEFFRAIKNEQIPTLDVSLSARTSNFTDLYGEPEAFTSYYGGLQIWYSNLQGFEPIYLSTDLAKDEDPEVWYQDEEILGVSMTLAEEKNLLGLKKGQSLKEIVDLLGEPDAIYYSSVSEKNPQDLAMQYRVGAYEVNLYLIAEHFTLGTIEILKKQ